MKLIDLVVHQGFKIRRASKMLKINESTAKSILKLYRQTGNMTVRATAQKKAFTLKNHSENPREFDHKNGTLPRI
jgi:transposase